MNKRQSLLKRIRSKSPLRSSSSYSKRKMVLTPQRLVQLSKYPLLKNSWYFIAAATFSVCNQPNEVARLVHYALKQSQYESSNKSIIDPVQLAQDAIDRAELIKKLNHEGAINDPNYQNPENLFSIDPKQNLQTQFHIAQKTRESILKSLALGGIPKAINTMMHLKNATPVSLQDTKPNRDFDSSKTDQVRERGIEFWHHVYGKVSKRIINQMNTAYPDLWEYAKNHIYSPLLSYSDILTPKETSLVIIGCLVPQDVNPQLKGHLKGALNNGATPEEVEQARQLALSISEWCDIKWKEDVAKLKL